MFQKKQMIYSEVLGVCRVENIVPLSVSREEPAAEYYVLKPVSGNRQAAYIPVKNHSQVLRELFTVEEARTLKARGAAGNDPVLQSALEYVLNGQCK